MRSRPALAAMVGVGAALMTAAPAAADNCLAFKAKVQNAHNGDVITLDEGLTCNDTYVLPSDRTGPFSITIRGAGTGATLDGTAQLTQIMTGEPTAGHQMNVTIRRLTFRNGTTASGSGGALELAGAHVSATLDRDRFLGNSAPAGLGAPLTSSRPPRRE